MFAQAVRSQGPEATADRLSAIDYFGTGQTNGAHIGSKRKGEDEEEHAAEHDSESDSTGATGRENIVKAKKKKKSRNQGNEEGGWLKLSELALTQTDR